MSVALSSTQAERARAIGLLLLSAAMWSTGGLLIKSVEWNAPAISATRSAIAALTIAAIYRGRLRFTWSRWQIAAALAYAGTVVLFVLATKLTTAANAILLQYTAPVYIAIAAPWFLGEPSRRSDWIIIVVTLAGMGLFFFDELSARGLAGNLAAIAAGVSFALLTLFLCKQRSGAVVESIVLGNLLAALIGVPFLHGPFPSPAGWGMLAILGVFQLGLSYVAYAAAVRHATAMDVALIPMLEPILNPIWVLLVMGERPGGWAIAGGAVVVGAVTSRAVLAVRSRAPRARSKRTDFPAATS